MAVNLKGIKSAMTWGIFYAMNKNRELSLSKIPEKYAYLKDFIRVVSGCMSGQYPVYKIHASEDF